MSWGDNSSAAGTQYHDRDGNISIFTNALVTFSFDLSFIPKLHFLLIYTVPEETMGKEAVWT